MKLSTECSPKPAIMSQLVHEELAKEVCQDVLKHFQLSKPILKKMAKAFFSHHQDILLKEVDQYLVAKRDIDHVLSSIQTLITIADLDINVIWDKLKAHPNFHKANGYRLEHFFRHIKDESFDSFVEDAAKAGGKQFQNVLENHYALNRITEYKSLKTKAHLVPLMENYFTKLAKDKNEYLNERYLAMIGSVANFSEKLAPLFEANYLHYLENGRKNYEWEKRIYISTLCRALRAYKSKEFRNVLIKKLVVLKMPTLQKRLSREFARSRRYINMAE